MDKKNNKIITLLAFVILAFAICIGALELKSFKHEKEQKKLISSLYETIDLLKEEIKELKNPTKVDYLENGYNYLAIGNSITKHGLADYWWNEIGMAASTEENDFVHVLKHLLEGEKGNVFAYAYNFSIWEMQAHDRQEALCLLDPYLSDKLNLVTLQLGENATDTITLEADTEELIRYIQGKAPNAQIILLDDFLYDGKRSEDRAQAARATAIDFVSLSEMRGKEEYLCGLGTIVYDKEGNPHTVLHNGVAAHPGDAGMKYLAEQVFKVVK